MWTRLLKSKKEKKFWTRLSTIEQRKPKKWILVEVEEE